MIGEFLEMVEAASEATILKSRKNCHAMDVSSIVVSEDEGRLTRAFLAWPGNLLHTNTLKSHLAVGIHDHRYDLSLKLIGGMVWNTTYVRDDRSPHRLTEWRFQSGVKTGVPTVERAGDEKVGLLPATSERLTDDRWLTLNANELHNIEAFGLAGWLVREGETRKDTTTLFTKRPVDTTGFYGEFMSKSEVVDHVKEWAYICIFLWT